MAYLVSVTDESQVISQHQGRLFIELLGLQPRFFCVRPDGQTARQNYMEALISAGRGKGAAESVAEPDVPFG